MAGGDAVVRRGVETTGGQKCKVRCEGGGVDTAAMATSARSTTIGGELASTEVVDGRGEMPLSGRV